MAQLHYSLLPSQDNSEHLSKWWTFPDSERILKDHSRVGRQEVYYYRNSAKNELNDLIINFLSEKS